MADGTITINTEIDQKGAEKGTQNLQKKLDGTAKKAKAVGGNMTKYLTAPLLAIGGMGFAAADNLDKAYNNIRAGTGATGEALEKLKDDFNDVFSEVPQSADEVSNVLADVNTATGATDDNLQDLTKTVLDAARAYDINSESLTENAMKALNRWNIEAEDGVEHMDKLAVVAEDTGVGMDELASLIAEHKGTLEGYGMGFDEAAGFMGELEKAGFDVNGVVREMRSSMEKLAEDGKDPSEAFQELSEKMMDAESQSEATAIAQEIFGSRAADVAEAVRDGKFDFEDFTKTLDDSDGTIEKVGEDTMTMGDKFAKIKNKAQQGLEPLGEVLLNLAEKALPPVVSAVESVANWFSNLSPVGQKVVIVIGALLAAIGPLLIMLGMMAGAITAITAPFLLWTVLIGAVITFVVGLAIAIAKNWDKIKERTEIVWNFIKDFFSTLWDGIKNKFTTTVDAIKNAVSTAWNWIKDTTSSVWNGIKDFFSSFWEGVKGVFRWYIDTLKNNVSTVWNAIKSVTSSVWNGIKAFITRVWDGIKNSASFAFNFIKDSITNVWNAIKSVSSSVWNGIKNTVSGIWNGMKNTVSNIFNGIKDTITNVWESVKSTTSRIWDGIVDSIKGAINGVIGAINGMLNSISDIGISLPELPGWVPGDMGGGSISFPSIPNIPELEDGVSYALEDFPEGEIIEPVVL